MPTLDQQSLNEILYGYQNYQLPAWANAVLQGNPLAFMPPSVANTVSSLTGMGVPNTPPMGGSPATNTPFYNPAAANVGRTPVQAAQMIAAMSNQPGLDLPSPVSMTPPETGVFRPKVISDYLKSIATADYESATRLVPIPAGTMQFHTPEAVYGSRDILRQRNAMMSNQALMEATASGLYRAGAGYVGGTIGATIGAEIGGVQGAWTGWDLGSMTAELAAPLFEKPATNFMMFTMKPALLNRARAMRLGLASKGFVRGGSSLDVFGRGLSTQGAQRLQHGLRDLAEGFEDYNQEDIISMTQMAGEEGLLKLAQSPDQMTRKMKDVIKAVGVVAKVTGDPDVRSALQKLGKMEEYGLTLQEAETAFRNARTFARMAGITVKQLGAVASQGAQMAQQGGLTAGAGVNLGSGSAGLTGAYIAGGGVNETEMALFGGEQGMQQRVLQSFMGYLGGAGQNFLASLVSFDAQGRPTIDPNKLKQLQSGTNLRQLLGGTHLTPQQLQAVMLNQDVLTNELAKRAGPLGLMQSMGGIAKSLMQMQPGLSMGSALQQMGFSTKDARLISGMLQSRGMYQNAIRQQRVTERMDAVARAQEEAARPGYLRRVLGDILAPLNPLQAAGELKRGVYNPIEDWLADREIRQKYEELGLEAFQFNAIGGNEEEAGFMNRLMGRRNKSYSPKERAKLDISGMYALNKARGKNFWVAGVHSLFGVDNSPEMIVNKEIRDLTSTAASLRAGLASTPSQSAARVLELGKAPGGALGLSDRLASMMKRQYGLSVFGIGLANANPTQWRGYLRGELEKDPEYKKLGGNQKERLIDKIMAQAISQIGDEDPELAKDISSKVTELGGGVVRELEEAGYETSEKRQEKLKDLIEGVAGEDRWYLPGDLRSKPAQRAEEIAKNTITMLNKISSDPKEAANKLRIYMQYVTSKGTAKEKILKSTGLTTEDIGTISKAIKSSGMGDVIRNIRSRGGAAAVAGITALVTGAEGLTIEQRATQARMRLVEEISKQGGAVNKDDILNMSDEELQRYIRENGTELGFSEKQIKEAGSSVEGMYGVLRDVLGEGDVFAVEGEKMSGAGVSLPGAKTKDTEVLLNMQDMFTKPASTFRASADTSMDAARINQRAAKSFSASVRTLVHALNKQSGNNDDSRLRRDVDNQSPD